MSDKYESPDLIDIQKYCPIEYENLLKFLFEYGDPSPVSVSRVYTAILKLMEERKKAEGLIARISEYRELMQNQKTFSQRVLRLKPTDSDIKYKAGLYNGFSLAIQIIKSERGQ